MKKYVWIWILLGILVLGLGVEAVWWFNSRPNNSNVSSNTNSVVVSNTPVNVNPDTSRLSLLGSMQGFQSGLGFRGDQTLEGLAKQSWLSLLESSSFVTYLNNETAAQASNAALINHSPFSTNRDVVGEFTWNVIEPKEGKFDWTLTDAAMQAAGDAGVTVSAVIQPFSSWGSSETVPADKCVGIDFVFMDYKGGLPQDMAKYEHFLQAVVERYDGDGLNDMAELATRVVSWEIGNEYEGPCSGSLNDPANYLTLLKASYATIKQSDPTALVLNAGALETIDGRGQTISDTVSFWNTFFAQGGADYLDVFNLHYNRERSEDLPDLTTWQTNLDFFRNLLDNSNHVNTSMWITEYGTFGGEIQEHHLGGPTVTLSRTEAEQAAWYFRTIITGLNAGMQKFFVDLVGTDGGGIGSSAWFKPNGETREFTTTMVAVAENLQTASSVVKLGEGQYKFETQTATVYALWDGTLPSDISGTVSVVALNGVTTEQRASSLIYSDAAPILVVVPK